MEYVWGIIGLGVACSLWMIIQIWSGKNSKGNNRWRGGGGCKGHVLLAACSLIMFATGCSSEDAEPDSFVQSIDPVMGTTIVVTAPPESGADKIVFQVFHDVDAMMSEWKPNSPLTKVNNAAGYKGVSVPDDLFTTVERSLQIAKLTSGAFDPTWAALWEVWKFTPETTDSKKQLPSKEQLELLLPLVNWELVELDYEQHTLFLPKKGMLIGLGGIAKGVALDQARDKLDTVGVKNYMIVAGGQVLVHGTKNGNLWRIGIRDPRTPKAKPNEFFAILSVTDTCVSTSGDYEKFFMLDGKRYHHIIDPRTGFPATGTRSVTVITPDATLADALSTALFVMGPVKAMQLVDSLDDVEAVIIDSDNHVHYSTHAKELIN